MRNHPLQRIAFRRTAWIEEEHVRVEAPHRLERLAIRRLAGGGQDRGDHGEAGRAQPVARRGVPRCIRAGDIVE